MFWFFGFLAARSGDWLLVTNFLFHNLIFGWVLKLLVVLSILNIIYNVCKLNVINGIYVNIVKHFFAFFYFFKVNYEDNYIYQMHKTP